MKRTLMVLVAAMFLLMGLSAASYAGIGPDYYSNPNPSQPYDPVDNGPHNWVWPSPPWNPYVGQGPWPMTLQQDDKFLLGMDNYTIPTQYKHLDLVIYYHGTGNLALDGFGVGWDFRKAAGRDPEYTGSNRILQEGKTFTLMAEYFPQPEWEWFLFQNVGAGALDIDSVKMYTRCQEVPSLTEWGVVALAVLMLAAGAMVIVHRRRAMARV